MNQDNRDDLRLLAEALPAVSAQIRSSLASFYSAFERIATPERREADPDLDHQSALLQQSYFRLLRLSNNLTNASRLAGDVPLPMQTLDLTALAQAIYRECLPLAETMGLQLQFHADGAPLFTDANEDGVRCVLYHFLSNAFKFTKSGKQITIHCRREGSHLLISVEDEGCGIRDVPPEQLFERYLQSDLLSPSPCGFGLGLPIARQTAQAMGGQILLSAREEGTSAALILPIRTTGAILQESPLPFVPTFPRALVGLADALPVRAFLQNPKAQN